jgi:DNA-binding MarR family transcriptional regulator
MSNELGISKSAVSQTISRLEKKGVIVKDKDPYNKNELVISFTSFGQKAFGRYKKKQVLNRMHFDQYLKELSDNDRGVIDKFLNEMENVIDRLR